MANPSKGNAQLADSKDNALIGDQQAKVADAAAATAVNPAAPAAYSAHASGAIAVVSAAATDLDTTAAALEALRDEVVTYEIAISALIVDLADVRTQFAALVDVCEAHGLSADA